MELFNLLLCPEDQIHLPAISIQSNTLEEETIKPFLQFSTQLENESNDEWSLLEVWIILYI